MSPNIYFRCSDSRNCKPGVVSVLFQCLYVPDCSSLFRFVPDYNQDLVQCLGQQTERATKQNKHKSLNINF
jgi:hypothetical protein